MNIDVLESASKDRARLVHQLKLVWHRGRFFMDDSYWISKAWMLIERDGKLLEEIDRLQAELNKLRAEQ